MSWIKKINLKIKDLFYLCNIKISGFFGKIFGRKQKNLSALKRTRIIFIIVMFIYPVLQFTFFWLLPNINSFVYAFRRHIQYPLPHYIFTFDNFGRVFQNLFSSDEILSRAFKNSFIYFIFTNIIGIPVTMILSYFLYKKIFCYKFFRAVFFLPSVISGVVLATLFKNFLNPVSGPIQMFISNIMNIPMENMPNIITEPKYSLWTICIYTLWTGFGVNLVMFNSAIARVPGDVIEYGKLEGVGMARELVQLIIPMILPTLTTVIILGVAGIFTFLQPVMLLNPPGKSGITQAASIGYYIFYQINASLNNTDFASAVGIVFGFTGVAIVAVIRAVLKKCTEAVEY